MASEPSNAELIASLKTDRQWLLRQIDAGRWPEWRLDLAALERELGQLLDQLAEAGLVAAADHLTSTGAEGDALPQDGDSLRGGG